MTVKHLYETATLVEATDSDTWRVKLINEGKGSSGVYPAETLEKYHNAFNGVLSFENHPSWMDGPENRNFTQIVGKVVGETWAERDEQGKMSVYANWSPDPDHKERLSRYKENLGLSIYIEGDGHVDDDGEFVVDFFNEHDPYKSVDVVLAAGRGGRFEESMKAIYSQRSEAKTTSTPVGGEGKEIKTMDEKAIEAINALTTQVSALISAQTAKTAENVQVEADEKAVEEKLATITASLDAVEAAREDLLPSQVESLRNKAKTGADVVSLIEEYKAMVVEARELAESTSGDGVVRRAEFKDAADLGKVFG
jgi:hypothetical protein